MRTTKFKHPAVAYAEGVCRGKIKAPKYVILQCADFLRTYKGKNKKYIINENLLDKIYKILKILKMAKGPKAGKSIYSALAGYQWLLITAVLCTVYRKDKRMRRYQTAVLEICRKNGKTFVVAVLLFCSFTWNRPTPGFSRWLPMGRWPEKSRRLWNRCWRPTQKCLRITSLRCCGTTSRTIPQRQNIRRLITPPAGWTAKSQVCLIADEVGALPTSYPVEAMRSGQLLIKK